MKPHRGTLILVLGILGLVACAFCAPAAWLMATADLVEMDAGMMDPSGRDYTSTGRILGMIGTLMMAGAIVLMVLWVVLMGVMVSVR